MAKVLAEFVAEEGATEDGGGRGGRTSWRPEEGVHQVRGLFLVKGPPGGGEP